MVWVCLMSKYQKLNAHFTKALKLLPSQQRVQWSLDNPSNLRL